MVNENYFSNIDWLKQRGGKFTASECHKLFVGAKSGGDLFGEGAKTYIFTKVAELLTGEVKEEVNFKQAEWAYANEPEASILYEKSTGLKGDYYGAANPKFFSDTEYTGVSPDWDHPTLKRGAEFKCPFNSAEHVRHLTLRSGADLKKAKKEYFHQIQMQMEVRKWALCDFVSYDPRVIEQQYRLFILTIYPDAAWRKEYAERVQAAVEIVETMVYGHIRTKFESKTIEAPANNSDAPLLIF